MKNFNCSFNFKRVELEKMNVAIDDSYNACVAEDWVMSDVGDCSVS